jgi:hypothetical protein
MLKETLTEEEEVLEASKRLGIPPLCVKARLALGWSARDAAHKPPQRRAGYVRRSWAWLERTGLLNKAKT